MREFKTLKAFGKYLDETTKKYDVKEHACLEILGAYLEHEVKETIGHLQVGAGEYESWEPLAESTISDKQRKGYDFNDEHNPLFRTGEMKESIKHHVGQHTVSVGSDSDIMVYQELGTTRGGQPHIPPRSMLALTFFKEKKHIQIILADFLMSWIVDRKQKKITHA